MQPHRRRARRPAGAGRLDRDRAPRRATRSSRCSPAGLAVFPPPVLDAGETFFSATEQPSKDTPGRRYRGVLAPGERLKSVEIRVVAALMEHAQYLLDRYGAAADPYMTVVDYFTSTRELAGMRRLVEDDVADRLASQQVRTRRRRPQGQRADQPDAEQPDRGDASPSWSGRSTPRFDSTAALEEFRRDPRGPREDAADRHTAARRAAGDEHAAGRRGRAAARPDGRHRPAEEHRRVHPGHLADRPRPEPAGPGGHDLPVEPPPGPGALRGVRLRPRHVRDAGRGPDHHAVQRPGPGPRADRRTGHRDAPLRDRRAGQHRRARGAAVRAGRDRAARRRRATGRAGHARPAHEPRQVARRAAAPPGQLARPPQRGAAPGGSATRWPPTSPGCSATRTRELGPVVGADAACARSRPRSSCSWTATTAASTRRRRGATTAEQPAGDGRVMDACHRRTRHWPAPRPTRIGAGPAQPPGHHGRRRRDRRPAVDERRSSAAWTPGTPSARRRSTSPGCWTRCAGCSGRRCGRCGMRRGTRPESDDPYTRVGVPVTPFPRWVRCPRCYRLGPAGSARPVRAGPPLRPPARPGQVRARAAASARPRRAMREQARLRPGAVPGRLRGRAPGRLPLRRVRARRPDRGRMRRPAADHVRRGQHARAAGHRAVRRMRRLPQHPGRRGPGRLGEAARPAAAAIRTCSGSYPCGKPCG